MSETDERGPMSGLSFSHSRALADDDRHEVAALVERATRTDGVGPIDDQVRSELAHGAASDAAHVLVRSEPDGRIVGYAHLAVDPSVGTAHLVVDPDRRRHGIGDAIIEHLLRLASGSGAGAGVAGEAIGPAARVSERRLLVWAHGDTPGAQALAGSRSFSRVRDLWQMRRPLGDSSRTDPLPEASYDDDVAVRAFRPGSDDEAWVRLNAAAFASHPEQGRLTLEDLHHRMDEDWFDPAGFFVAERAGELVGSHWTKVHPAGESGAAPVGEVYAVGVHPDAQGIGLGKALTLTGLHHLAGLGLSEVMLYVDGDNTAAVRLYAALGFERTAVDVMYASP
jgi:mycothiol synthase